MFMICLWLFDQAILHVTNWSCVVLYPHLYAYLSGMTFYHFWLYILHFGIAALFLDAIYACFLEIAHYV